MTDELVLPADGDRGLGLRHDEERRHAERRATERGVHDRRRSVRRRARLRNFIFTAMALSIPHHLKHSQLKLNSAVHAAGPRVSTSIDSVFAISPKEAYESIIREAAALYRVSPDLIRSVVQAESAFDPMAISRTGAMGLMQLMPEVARVFEIQNPFDPRENIMGGTRLLRELLDSHHNNIPLVLAAYNAGPAAVARYRGIPPFRETRGYVKKITSLLADARNAGND
jgi:soluble lytic murein transglycosylase-like protein